MNQAFVPLSPKKILLRSIGSLGRHLKRSKASLSNLSHGIIPPFASPLRRLLRGLIVCTCGKQEALTDLEPWISLRLSIKQLYGGAEVEGVCVVHFKCGLAIPTRRFHKHLVVWIRQSIPTSIVLAFVDAHKAVFIPTFPCN